MDFQKIIDISLPLNDKTIIYTNTTQLRIEEKRSPTGSRLSEITINSHTGTHIDAPIHAIPNGIPLDGIDLHCFLGSCRVLDFTQSMEAVTKEDLNTKNIQPQERILLKTNNSERGFDSFYDDYIYLSPEGAEYVAEIGITLLGIDSLSVKKRGEKDNTSHTALLSKNIPIIEGLNLKEVTEGTYTLLALPLAFSGIDGSPARVLLLKDF